MTSVLSKGKKIIAPIIEHARAWHSSWTPRIGSLITRSKARTNYLASKGFGIISDGAKWALRARGLIVLIVVTVLLVSFGLFIFLTQSAERAAQAGDLIAGVSGASALLWLVAGYYQQSRDLTLQRKELELQRRALESQTKELAQAGKFSALGQVNLLLKNADEYIGKSKAPASNSNELANNISSIIADLPLFNRSVNAQEICDQHVLFIANETAAKSFLSSVRAATLLYAEADPKIKVQSNNDPLQFIHQNDQLLRSLPYIANYQGDAWSIAYTMQTLEPGFKTIQLAGMTAFVLIAENPEVVYKEPMQQLYKEVTARGKPPAICALFDYENYKIR